MNYYALLKYSNIIISIPLLAKSNRGLPVEDMIFWGLKVLEGWFS